MRHQRRWPGALPVFPRAISTCRNLACKAPGMTLSSLTSGVCIFLLSAVVSAVTDPGPGNLTRKRIDAPVEIQGYPCSAGYTWFFSDGGLRECAVSREFPFGELVVPANSWINLRHDGRPDFVFLAHDARVGGYLCKGGGVLGPTEGASTALYPDGKLKTCWLVDDSLVDGVPCEHAGFWTDAFVGNSSTEFHENGKLKSCRLARDFPIGGRSLRRGDRIQLDENGGLASSATHPR